MKLIALIDGGGTKTRIRFLNQADQTVISEIVTGPSNLGLGADVCWEQIMQAITLAGVPMPVKCRAGLAGSEYAKQRSAFYSILPVKRCWFQTATLGCLVRIAGCLAAV